VRRNKSAEMPVRTAVGKQKKESGREKVVRGRPNGAGPEKPCRQKKCKHAIMGKRKIKTEPGGGQQKRGFLQKTAPGKSPKGKQRETSGLGTGAKKKKRT